jgi:hypothetical protein
MKIELNKIELMSSPLKCIRWFELARIRENNIFIDNLEKSTLGMLVSAAGDREK